MAKVWESYPNGGGERLLALALADHADHDGGNIYPSVKTLSAKTKQDVRTVQRHLRAMEASGWLQLMSAGTGGGGGIRATSRYRINPLWIDHGKLPGVTSDPPGVTSDPPGVTAQPPEPSEPSRSKNKCPPIPPAQGRGAEEVGPTVPQAKRNRNPVPITLREYIDACKAQGRKPIPPGDPVFAYCADVGLPTNILTLHWREFKLRHLETAKRQADWQKTLLASVRGNWYRLWALRSAGEEAVLTTQGRQAEREFQAEQRRENESLAKAAGVCHREGA